MLYLHDTGRMTRIFALDEDVWEFLLPAFTLTLTLKVLVLHSVFSFI